MIDLFARHRLRLERSFFAFYVESKSTKSESDKHTERERERERTQRNELFNDDSEQDDVFVSTETSILSYLIVDGRRQARTRTQ
jgi:hypothetical protein